MWVLLWLISVVVVWRLGRQVKRQLEARGTPARYWLSSALTGLYISFAFAPGAVSAGFVVVPVPASLALTSELLLRSWREARLSLLSLGSSFVIVTLVHFPFARAARRTRQDDRLFDAAHTTRPNQTIQGTLQK